MINKDKIEIRGLRQHNLKNVSLNIPKGKIVVFPGVSGSGKSSIGKVMTVDIDGRITQCFQACL